METRFCPKPAAWKGYLRIAPASRRRTTSQQRFILVAEPGYGGIYA